MRARSFPALLAMCAMVLAACTPADEPSQDSTDPTELIEGFKSYTSRQTALAQLPVGTPLQIVEDSSLPPGDSRPPFSIYTARAQGFRHLGQPGTIQLSFFNDRLYSVTFFPDDYEALKKAMRTQGLNPPEKPARAYIGKTIVWTGIDYKSRPYAAWADRQLQEQIDRWIQKYS